MHIQCAFRAALPSALHCSELDHGLSDGVHDTGSEHVIQNMRDEQTTHLSNVRQCKLACESDRRKEQQLMYEKLGDKICQSHLQTLSTKQILYTIMLRSNSSTRCSTTQLVCGGLHRAVAIDWRGASGKICLCRGGIQVDRTSSLCVQRCYSRECQKVTTSHTTQTKEQYGVDI